MTWRIARLDIDTVLAADSQASFETADDQRIPGNSFLSALKQRFSSDEELALQLQNGNADALAVLFKRHSPLLFAIARRILKNDTEAEDAVQQIFLDVFRSIHQFDARKGTFKTWLLMFAYHRSFNNRRSQRANHFFETDPLEGYGAQLLNTRRPNPEDGILLEQILRSLQSRQRRTIELIYYEGLTAEEVSSRTGESVRVVRHNLYRGLDKLRQVYQQNADPHQTKGE